MKAILDAFLTLQYEVNYIAFGRSWIFFKKEVARSKTLSFSVKLRCVVSIPALPPTGTILWDLFKGAHSNRDRNAVMVSTVALLGDLNAGFEYDPFVCEPLIQSDSGGSKVLSAFYAISAVPHLPCSLRAHEVQKLLAEAAWNPNRLIGGLKRLLESKVSDRCNHVQVEICRETASEFMDNLRASNCAI